jgi:hypothetical protein
MDLSIFSSSDLVFVVDLAFVSCICALGCCFYIYSCSRGVFGKMWTLEMSRSENAVFGMTRMVCL